MKKTINQDRPQTKQSNLIHLRDFVKTHSDYCLTEIREYWNKERKGGPIPYKSDIHAADIGKSVDYAFIGERIARGMARFRMAGQQLYKVMGMEIRGLPLASIFCLSSRDKFSKILESVFGTPQIAQLWLSAPAEYSHPHLTARMQLLPLKSDLGDITRVLGCLSVGENIGKTPCRFDLERYNLSPVEAQPKAPASHHSACDRSAKASATPEQKRNFFTVISDNKTNN